ncbi:MAG: hypothetical protein ABL962_08105, partial [Fimbriimonadaceae bacterium]
MPFTFLVFGLLVLWWIREEIYLWIRAQRWRSTKGVVIKSDAFKRPGFFNHLKSYHQRHEITYWHILYQFEIDGKIFASTRVRFD